MADATTVAPSYSLPAFASGRDWGTATIGVSVNVAKGVVASLSFTGQAGQADNDLAIGRYVDAISHSSVWNSTAIFVEEDDAQNGVDHVDGHREVSRCGQGMNRRGREEDGAI